VSGSGVVFGSSDSEVVADVRGGSDVGAGVTGGTVSGIVVISVVSGIDGKSVVIVVESLELLSAGIVSFVATEYATPPTISNETMETKTTINAFLLNFTGSFAVFGSFGSLGSLILIDFLDFFDFSKGFTSITSDSFKYLKKAFTISIFRLASPDLYFFRKCAANSSKVAFCQGDNPLFL